MGSLLYSNPTRSSLAKDDWGIGSCLFSREEVERYLLSAPPSELPIYFLTQIWFARRCGHSILLWYSYIPRQLSFPNADNDTQRAADHKAFRRPKWIEVRHHRPPAVTSSSSSYCPLNYNHHHRRCLLENVEEEVALAAGRRTDLKLTRTSAGLNCRLPLADKETVWFLW